MKTSERIIVLFLSLAASASAGMAELSKAEKNQAKAMLSGTLYLRIDAPCGT